MLIEADLLNPCKAYMHVDGDEDDELISSFYAAAQEFLGSKGIYLTADNSSRYTLAVHSLTNFYYDHRDAVSNEASLPIGIQPIIRQLKWDAEVNAAAKALEV